MRLRIEAILWILRTGAPWRDLPEVFGRWKSVYGRFRAWTESGLWPAMLNALGRANEDKEAVMGGQHGNASARPWSESRR